MKKKINVRGYESDWREHNKTMKRKHIHSMVFDTIDEYIAYRFGKVQHNTEFKELKVSKSYRKSDPVHSLLESNSLPSPKSNESAKKSSLKYSGTYIVGISTTHKSNAVPVTSREQATEIARMRR